MKYEKMFDTIVILWLQWVLGNNSFKYSFFVSYVQEAQPDITMLRRVILLRDFFQEDQQLYS